MFVVPRCVPSGLENSPVRPCPQAVTRGRPERRDAQWPRAAARRPGRARRPQRRRRVRKAAKAVRPWSVVVWSAWSLAATSARSATTTNESDEGRRGDRVLRRAVQEHVLRDHLRQARARRREAHRPRVNIASVARRGVQDPEVITARIIQDERGWLRLAS